MGYVSYPIESNPFTLLADAYAYIQGRSPAWQPFDANLDTWILQATATQASDLRIIATDVPDTIFRYFGSTILGIPPHDATTAMVQSTWHSIDALGHLIPAGTLVGIRDTSGTLRGFRTLNDITILPGLNMTNVGEVTLIAVEAGAASEGIGANDEVIELVDPLDFVSSVVLTGTTAGGADAESINDYTNRLAEYMRGLSTRPILPEDYARMVKSFPGVYRALAIDGYNPTDDSYFNARTVSVFPIDQFGLDMPDEVMADIDDQLQAQREVNFLVYVLKASRTTVNVDFSVGILPNASSQETIAAAEAAVISYLSPANWGLDPTMTGSGASRTWVETNFVRYNKIIQVIENVQGVEYVQALHINRLGDAPANTNVVLDQPAALTDPGIITGAVFTP